MLICPSVGIREVLELIIWVTLWPDKSSWLSVLFVSASHHKSSILSFLCWSYFHLFQPHFFSLNLSKFLFPTLLIILLDVFFVNWPLLETKGSFLSHGKHISCFVVLLSGCSSFFHIPPISKERSEDNYF